MTGMLVSDADVFNDVSDVGLLDICIIVIE